MSVPRHFDVGPVQRPVTADMEGLQGRFLRGESGCSMLRRLGTAEAVTYLRGTEPSLQEPPPAAIDQPTEPGYGHQVRPDPDNVHCSLRHGGRQYTQQTLGERGRTGRVEVGVVGGVGLVEGVVEASVMLPCHTGALGAGGFDCGDVNERAGVGVLSTQECVELLTN